MSGDAIMKRDNLALGIAAIIVSVFALSFGDAVIKFFSVNFPLWQLYVIRSLLALPLLFAVLRFRRNRPPLKIVSVPWVAIRGMLLASMWVAYYAALPNVQLSLAAAAYYTSPLFIVLLAALFTGDRVGPGRWFAVFLGFAGILIMLRPGADDFNTYALLPVAAAILYALAMVLTRTKCPDEDPVVLAITLNVTFIIVGGIGTALIALIDPDPSIISANSFLFDSWATLQTNEWLALGVLAMVIVVGSVGAAIAYQAATPSIIATFDYSYLAFATFWGLLFFAELPDAISLVGMSTIVAAGLIAVKR